MLVGKKHCEPVVCGRMRTSTAGPPHLRPNASVAFSMRGNVPDDEARCARRRAASRPTRGPVSDGTVLAAGGLLRMRGDRRASCLMVEFEGPCNVSALLHYTQGALSRPDSARAN
jgi:hypothetical protein